MERSLGSSRSPLRWVKRPPSSPNKRIHQFHRNQDHLNLNNKASAKIIVPYNHGWLLTARWKSRIKSCWGQSISALSDSCLTREVIHGITSVVKTQEIISFKTDSALKHKLENLTNRSDFIRNALLVALNNVCEFCKGAGILSSEMRRHWNDFSRKHTVVECDEDDCGEIKVNCGVKDESAQEATPGTLGVLTFKVSKEIAGLLKGIENRSEFIRNAIFAAFESICPWCKGSGVLNPKQKEHWTQFSKKHKQKECGDCHGLTLSCAKN